MRRIRDDRGLSQMLELLRAEKASEIRISELGESAGFARERRFRACSRTVNMGVTESETLVLEQNGALRDVR